MGFLIEFFKNVEAVNKGEAAVTELKSEKYVMSPEGEINGLLDRYCSEFICKCV